MSNFEKSAADMELIVIGGGPAGIAAALAAHKAGLRDIMIIERDRELGGILNQCIHNGFGLHYFKQELTGPEYAGRFISMLKNTDIQVSLDTMALDVTPNKQVHAVSMAEGYRIFNAKSIVLAMGCRERTRGAIGIPGTRPAGILTAGTAQRYVNMEGYMVGRRVVILGSGDVGLIMARRLTLEGAKVLACVELMPYSGGLTRNIVQCLGDYGIPLYLSHTITDIQGSRRVERVIISEVDETRTPIPGTEMELDCDTILLSVGLIPENELTKKAGIDIDSKTGGAVVYENTETSVPGIFACGNALHVHDLVDYVTMESERAGKAAAEFVRGDIKSEGSLSTGKGCMRITGSGAWMRSGRALSDGPKLSARDGDMHTALTGKTELICIVCPTGCRLVVDEELNVTGNACPRGESYGKEEVSNPTRIVTSTVRIKGGSHRRCPVKTNKEIPKALIFEAMKTLDGVELQSPVKMGDIVVPDVCGTGADFVTTRDM